VTLFVVNAAVVAFAVFVLIRWASEKSCACGGRLRDCETCGGTECLRCGAHKEGT
jgi:hypothetical protein